MNKEKQIIEEKKESVRDFYEREIKDTRSIVKELSKITLYGTLTDATGDFADFYIKDIVKVLDKALSSQRKDIVEKIEKILTRHSNWKPTCGYESEEEKGYQEGLQAEAGLIEKEIKEELNLIIKEDITDLILKK